MVHSVRQTRCWKAVPLQVQRQIQRLFRLPQKIHHRPDRSGQVRIIRRDGRPRKTPPQIVHQRLIRFREADEADALVRGPHQQPAERAISERRADALALSAAPRRARRHPKQRGGLLVNAAFRPEARFRHRVDHPVAVRQRGVQPAGPHALGIAARRQPGMITEHPQEVEARIAGPFRQGVQRRDVLAGLDERAGVADHLLRDPGPFALRIAPLAGTEAGGLGLGRASEETHVRRNGRGDGHAGRQYTPMVVTA